MKNVSPLDFYQYNSSIVMFMCTYATFAVKRKSFYGKSELHMFLLISGGRIGAPKQYTNMASPYKALTRCMKCFDK